MAKPKVPHADSKEIFPNISLPKSQRIFADAIHWCSIFIAVVTLFALLLIVMLPAENILNPNRVFTEIFAGSAPADIWSLASEPGIEAGKLHLRYLNKVDVWAELILYFSCGIGLWTLLPAIIYQIFKEKEYRLAINGLVLFLLILLSMIGVLSVSS